MSEEEQELYDEGYSAYYNLFTENPYSGMDAEFWNDGWEDAQDDEAQE